MLREILPFPLRLERKTDLHKFEVTFKLGLLRSSSNECDELAELKQSLLSQNIFQKFRGHLQGFFS